LVWIARVAGALFDELEKMSNKGIVNLQEIRRPKPFHATHFVHQVEQGTVESKVHLPIAIQQL